MTAFSIRVKSCNAFLGILLVCIRSYLKSVMRYKFLILNTYHSDSLYFREHGCGNPWLLFEAERSEQAKSWGNTALYF